MNISKDLACMGTENRPPVLYKGEYEQWRDRFLFWIQMHDSAEEILASITNGPAKFYTVTEAKPDNDPEIPEILIERGPQTEGEHKRKKADVLATNYILWSLTNDIYHLIDSEKTAKAKWDKLEQLMKTHEVADKLRAEAVMTAFKQFSSKPGETIQSVYERYSAIMNEMQKCKVALTNQMLNIGLLDSLPPEWETIVRIIKRTEDLDLYPVYKVYESLKEFQADAKHELIIRKKLFGGDGSIPTDAETSQNLALVSVSKGKEVKVESSTRESKVNSCKSDGDSSDSEVADLSEQLALLTQRFQKKFYKQGPSNQLRYTSGSRRKDGYQAKDRRDDQWENRSERRDYRNDRKDDSYQRRYDERREDYYQQRDERWDDREERRRDDRYDNRYERRNERRDDRYERKSERFQGKSEVENRKEDRAEEKSSESKNDPKFTCFKCGETGHYARECKNKVVRDANYYKRKALLAAQIEEGKALIANAEEWQDDITDDEDDKLMNARFCYMVEVVDHSATSGTDHLEDESQQSQAEDDKCMMAKTEEQASVSSGNQPSNSEVFSETELKQQEQIDCLNVQIKTLNEKYSEALKEIKRVNSVMKNERILFLKLDQEKAVVVDLKKDLQKSYDKTSVERNTLQQQLNEAKENLKLEKIESDVNKKRFEVIQEERCKLYSKIKFLEDKLVKRGQTYQTIMMNLPKENSFYNLKEGLGFSNLKTLEKAQNILPTLYDYRYMGKGYKARFHKTTDEASKEEDEKRSSNNCHEFPFVYKKLNESYSTRIPEPEYCPETYSKSEGKSENSHQTHPYIPQLVLENEIRELQDQILELQKKEKHDLESKDHRNKEKEKIDIPILTTEIKNITSDQPSCSNTKNNEVVDNIVKTELSTVSHQVHKANDDSSVSDSVKAASVEIKNKSVKFKKAQDAKSSTVVLKSCKPEVNATMNRNVCNVSINKRFDVGSTSASCSKSSTKFASNVVLKTQSLSSDAKKQNLFIKRHATAPSVQGSKFYQKGKYVKDKNFMRKPKVKKLKLEQLSQKVIYQWVPKSAENRSNPTTKWMPTSVVLNTKGIQNETHKKGPIFAWVPKI